MSKVTVQEVHEEDAAAGADRRRSARADLIVRVDYSTVDEIFSEFTRDINEGGLFIETEKPSQPGTEVMMQFHLPATDERIETVGVVVRVSTGDASMPSGMGIEFEELSHDDRKRINQIIRDLRSSRPGR
ncbi:MAG: TIGR02266 family protein [Deltaproteobacteria bacterium]|nr:TIGR02266 family protein [Deltaproteobacteria bacterium]MBW2382967.1 TIGR02266 family protein [Deltaproteobacteria bacterium]MBW2696945.1 TIGR02266 family protein [Deltaproteobacteria bacterium]